MESLAEVRSVDKLPGLAREVGVCSVLCMVLRRLVAVAAVCTLTGCGASTAHTVNPSTGTTIPTAMNPISSPSQTAVQTTGGTGHSAALSARLLAEDSVPAGFTVESAMTVSPEMGERPRADAPCSDSMIPLLSATRLTGTPSAMATATISNDSASENLWVGTEFLRTYTGDGAQQALTDLRTFVNRCPTVTASGQTAGVFRYAAPGPRLGDDSLHVSCSMTADSGVLECNSVVVRIGSDLVEVAEQGNETSGDGYLTQVAEAAVRKYQSTKS